MDVKIIESPKLYLDTNHLVNIARLRNDTGTVQEVYKEAYRFIDKCIREMHVGLVFNLAAPLDWVNGDATLESAIEIADIFESAQLQYEIEADTFVYLHEVLREIEAFNNTLSLPDFDIFFVRDREVTVTSAILVLRKEVPDFFDANELLPGVDDAPTSVCSVSIRECVQRAWKLKTERPSVFQERNDGFRAALQHDLNVLGSRRSKSITQADKVNWCKQRLKVDRILTRLHPNIDVNETLQSINLENCPATILYLKAHEKRIRNQNQSISDSDVDDWLYLPVISYCDVILMERSLRGYVCQADKDIADKTTHDPRDAARMLEKWISPATV